MVLLSCSYDDREFVRVGYYVNNEYVDEALNADPPAKPIIEKVRRNILAEKPRVTRFAIKWFVFVLVDLFIGTNITIGTPKNQPQLNTHQSSLRPTLQKTMRLHTGPKRRKRS